jgi:GAF domain
MIAHSTLDPEAFQNLLSNAFLVQESGMDPESLSAIVELQRSIAMGELDVDGAMDLIVVRARNVADASGIAIGLLTGDQLVYRAGSGSAAAYVGEHVMATLCVSAHNAASGEILRVENTQTDARIEAAICRQFGAQSLLILPIYHGRAVAGVLGVLFNEAHVFLQREVRSYRLMADLVGEAMSYATRTEQKKALAADLSTMRRNIGQIRPQIKQALNDGGSVPSAATSRAICQACGNPIAEARNLPALRQSPWVVSKRAKRVPLYKGRWETAVAVAALLVIACWIAYRDRRPALPFGASALQISNVEQQIPFEPAKRVLANSTSEPQTMLDLKEEEWKAARTMPKWVWVGNTELDYVTQDVTVRYLTPKHAPQRVLDRNEQVRYISEDVTVRYFTPKHAVSSWQRPIGSTARPVDR